MKTLSLYLPYSCPFSCTFELYLRSFFPSLIISNNSFLKCARHSKAPRRIVCTLAASGLNISQYDILCQAPLHIFFTFFHFFCLFYTFFAFYDAVSDRRSISAFKCSISFNKAAISAFFALTLAFCLHTRLSYTIKPRRAKHFLL